MYYDILMRAAIDDDRAKKRVSKGTKTTTQLTKAERRKANKAITDGGRGSGRGRGGGRGRGRGRGRGGDSSNKTYVDSAI